MLVDEVVLSAVATGSTRSKVWDGPERYSCLVTEVPEFIVAVTDVRLVDVHPLRVAST